MLRTLPIAPKSILAALVLSVALAGVVRADDADDARTVSTTGTASVFVTPDRADVPFTVRSFNEDLQKAKAASDKTAAEAIRFLKDRGVDEKRIQTALAQSVAVYDETFENGRRIRGPIKGYEVTRSYSVRVDDLAKLTEIVDHLLTNESIQIEGLSFSSKEDRTHRDAARKQAALAAREKATLLAETLGASLGSVRSIDEASLGPIMPMNRFANVASTMSGGADDSGEATPVGQIEIRAHVTVRFDLNPAQKVEGQRSAE